MTKTNIAVEAKSTSQTTMYVKLNARFLETIDGDQIAIEIPTRQLTTSENETLRRLFPHCEEQVAASTLLTWKPAPWLISRTMTMR